VTRRVSYESPFTGGWLRKMNCQKKVGCPIATNGGVRMREKNVRRGKEGKGEKKKRVFGIPGGTKTRKQCSVNQEYDT